ncbi:hypothetical protein ABZ070_37315 [Streptomyces sp. NPDC006283]|uniref:hypothetical protein n=1 Tax=Streptomyces sp. NPDC006283 TaxID=3156741 RepID=UPI00339F5C55
MATKLRCAKDELEEIRKQRQALVERMIGTYRTVLERIVEVHPEAGDRQSLHDPQLAPSVPGVAVRVAGGDVLLGQ